MDEKIKPHTEAAKKQHATKLKRMKAQEIVRKSGPVEFYPEHHK